MPDGPRPKGPNYEDDFYAWTQYQAEVLRTLPTADNRFDREHLAEEIEDLGRSYRDAVRSQVRRILAHCLKLAYSAARDLEDPLVLTDYGRRAATALDMLISGPHRDKAVARIFGVSVRTAKYLRAGEHWTAERFTQASKILGAKFDTALTGVPFSTEKGKSERELAQIQVCSRFDWMDSIIDARGILDDKLSPSLRRDLGEILPRLYTTARKRAAVELLKYDKFETAQSLPAECPYTIDQILAEDWYPDPAAGANGNTGSGDVL